MRELRDQVDATRHGKGSGPAQQLQVQYKQQRESDNDWVTFLVVTFRFQNKCNEYPSDSLTAYPWNSEIPSVLKFTIILILYCTGIQSCLHWPEQGRGVEDRRQDLACL